MAWDIFCWVVQFFFGGGEGWEGARTKGKTVVGCRGKADNNPSKFGAISGFHQIRTQRWLPAFRPMLLVDVSIPNVDQMFFNIISSWVSAICIPYMCVHYIEHTRSIRVPHYVETFC